MERDTLDIEDGVTIIINEKEQTTIVDPEDVEFVLNNRWRYDGKGYVTRGIRRNGKYKKFYLHREILLWHGFHIPKGRQVDHINRAKTDNRKGNLRIVTKSQNQANRKSDKQRYKGVTFNKRTGLYEARIQIEHKSLFLGSFPNDREAAYYYNEAAKQIHGEYAVLNNLDNTRPRKYEQY